MSPEPRGQVVLVRHGETDWSRDGRHTGRTDVPLNTDGRHQGADLGKPLSRRAFAQVLTSPLSRAVDTCELAGLAATAERIDDLQEWDYGAYEGLTSEQIWAQRPGWTLWKDGVPDGETAPEVAARADRALALIRATVAPPTGDVSPTPSSGPPLGDAAGDVAVFAHGHLLRVLAARWLGLDPAAGRYLALHAASMSVLGWEHEQPVVVAWNDVGHLSPSGSGP